jgi:AcrR family transcriptional regulator
MNKRSGIESKKIIMKAAMDVFSRHGYAEANIRKVAEKAGVSVGSIYLYFKNKRELYRSLLVEKRREMAERTEAAVETAVNASQALSNFLRLYLEYAMKHREFIVLHVREHGFTFDLREKKQFFLSQRNLIEKIINNGVRTGEFRRCNVRETAKLVMGSLRGITLSIALDEDGLVRPEMVDEFFFHGLLSIDKKLKETDPI